MLHIETSGSWGDMGRQFGQAMRDALHKGVEGLAPKLCADASTAARVASVLRRRVSAHCPEVLEESQAMAEGAGLPSDILLGYRFLGEVNPALDVGCTVCFMNSLADGPLLGRNCDIEKDWTVGIQTCWVRRPTDGPAFIHNSYAGMVAPGAVMNEHGLGMGGASSPVIPAAELPAGGNEPPASLLAHMCMMHCRTVADAASLLARYRFFSSKGVNWIIADAAGRSTLVEAIPSEHPTQIPRPSDRRVQFCTNHSIRHVERIQPLPAYLQSSYARYGRLFHRLLEEPITLNRQNLAALMTEVAEPGVCIAEEGLRLHTCYTTLFDLTRRVQYLSDGHPTRAVQKEIAL